VLKIKRKNNNSQFEYNNSELLQNKAILGHRI